MVKKVIIDGDWGGDEMQLTSVLLAHKDKSEILGITATFGNTDHDQVFENGRNILHFLKASHIPCYPGAKGPTNETVLQGDGAHGSDGIGGVTLDESPAARQTKSAVDFILETLKKNEAGTISITASGPLTNISQAFQKDPETMRKVKEIVIMGGATHDMPAADTAIRRGNITHNGEFNFYMAANDASVVMESDLPIVLLPMNCTHQLTVTPERQEKVGEAFATNIKAKNAIIGMMTAPAELDKLKFNQSPVMHDVHCALYLLYPELYETQKGAVKVSTDKSDKGSFEASMLGHTEFVEDSNSKTQVAVKLKDPDKLFDIYLDSIKTCLSPKRKQETKTLKPAEILVVGSCNMDLTYFGNELPSPKNTVDLDDYNEGFGGKGANQAVSASKCGASVSFVSCVGKDNYGDETIENLKSFNINVEHVHKIEGMRTGRAPIFVDKDGQNAIGVLLGANMKISPEIVDNAVKDLKKPDSIIMQCEMPLETIYHTTEYAKANGITSMLNVAPYKPVDLKKLDGLDYFVVNEKEALGVSGLVVETQEDAIKAAKKILAESNIGKVIVTIGDKGCVLVGRREIIAENAFPVEKVVDTSGAGDAWLGCFAASHASGFSEKESMQRANLFSSMSIQKPGTQMSYPSTEEFEKKWSEVQAVKQSFKE